jgi:hypothetical protein
MADSLWFKDGYIFQPEFIITSKIMKWLLFLKSKIC